MTSKAFGLAQLGNAYADGALSNRNKIINGNFDIWQRGTSFSGPAGGGGYGPRSLIDVRLYRHTGKN